MLNFIIVLPDDRVKGFEDKDYVRGFLHDYYEERIQEYCEEEDLDYEDLSEKEQKFALEVDMMMENIKYIEQEVL